jgi:hypothetical protein
MKLNRSLAIGALALLLLLCFLTYTNLSASNDGVADVIDENAAASSVRTLGSVWRSDIAMANADSREKIDQPDFIDRQFSFDVHFLYEKLKQLELDESSHIRLSDVTRRALEEGLEATGLLLTDYDLASLKEAVQTSLPEALGIEASELILNFYDYLSAKEQVLGGASMPASIEGMKEYQAMLSDLRAATLGVDRTKRLFEKAENDMNFMLESMALNQVQDLTMEERAARIQALSQKYQQHERPADDLEGR